MQLSYISISRHWLAAKGTRNGRTDGTLPPVRLRCLSGSPSTFPSRNHQIDYRSSSSSSRRSLPCFAWCDILRSKCKWHLGDPFGFVRLSCVCEIDIYIHIFFVPIQPLHFESTSFGLLLKDMQNVRRPPCPRDGTSLLGFISFVVVAFLPAAAFFCSYSKWMMR